MAISANTVFEVRTGGSDLNGGGFVTGASGTDYSQQNGSNTTGNNISTTDAKSNNTTTITSALGSFNASIVGNIVYFQGGTGAIAAQWRQVTAFTNGTSIVIDTAIASSTAMTMNIGGALKTPGQVAGLIVAGNIAFFQNVGADGASVFSITSTTSNTSSGVIAAGAAGFFQGYTSTRSLGNTDARPTFQLNVSSATLFVSGNTGLVIQGIICDGNSQTTAKLAASAAMFVRCMFKNFNTATTSTPSFVDCSATTNSANIFAGMIAIRCEAYANTAMGFSLNAAIDCIASGNTGATTDGFNSAAVSAVVSGCISVANGRHGFNFGAASEVACINCHAESNTGTGFITALSGKTFINCSAFGNAAATSFTANVSNTGFITVTVGSVFVNAASNNYLLNNTANEGALLRAAADPATFPRGLTSNFRDIGAAQHQDSPSTTTTNIFIIDE